MRRYRPHIVQANTGDGGDGSSLAARFATLANAAGSSL
jgi:hypothetical protein